MALDIKELIGNLTEKVKDDKDIKSKFEKDPVKTIEELIGIKLPDEISESVINSIKATIETDGISGALGNLGSILGKK